MIYLDNNATTRPGKDLLNAVMMETFNNFGNPSSQHALGQSAKNLIENARDNLASYLGCNSSEIIFTSGGTEANNIALGLNVDNKICSTIEHSSVISCCDTFVKVNSDGTLDFDHLEYILNNVNGKLNIVSIMLANNETGVILDPNNKLKLLKEKYSFILHVDAVQAIGKLPIDLSNSHIDMLSISGHKIHALKGVGALYINKRLNNLINPIFRGGNHEFGVRPGTENVIGIASIDFIINKLKSRAYQNKYNKLLELTSRLEAGLYDISKINGSVDNRIGNTTNLYFPRISDLDVFLEILSENGVCVSGMSACSSGMPQPSRVIESMYGSDSKRLNGSVRFSVSIDTTEREIDKAIQIIKDVYSKCTE